MAWIYKLRAEPLPVCLLEPGISEGISGDPLLWGRTIHTTRELLLHSHPQSVLGCVRQRHIYGTKVTFASFVYRHLLSFSMLFNMNVLAVLFWCSRSKVHCKGPSWQLEVNLNVFLLGQYLSPEASL